MITIDDLIGIEERIRKEAIEVLDDLMAYKISGTQKAVITGYNWYTSATKSDSRVTFSNIHESEDYKNAMIRDLGKLGYKRGYLLERIREKGSMFFWSPDYRTRGWSGKILSGLKIKDLRTRQYINLRKYRKPLEEYKEFRDSKGHLIATDYGWEVDIPFRKRERLLRLVDLFLRKVGSFVYDETGEIILEGANQKELRTPWPGPYTVPVLLIGESALKYLNELPAFDSATRFSLVENNNEISFVVHKNLEVLRNLPHYERLIHIGFSEERCLGNKPFLGRVDQV